MAKRKSGLGGWLLIGLVIFGISQCNRSEDSHTGSSAVASRPSTTLPASPPSAVTARPPIQQPAAPVSAPSPVTRYVSASSLNVRSGPNTGAAVIGSLANGAQVRVFEMNGAWARLSQPDEAGRWVHGDYLSTQPPEPVLAPQTAIVQQPSEPTLSRNQIVQEIINRSIRSYPGNCPCPYNRASNGSRCGGRSAYSRPGGASPICYAGDVTEAMIQAFRR